MAKRLPLPSTLIWKLSLRNSLNPSLPLRPKWTIISMEIRICRSLGLLNVNLLNMRSISPSGIAFLCTLSSLPSILFTFNWAFSILFAVVNSLSLLKSIMRLYGGEVKWSWMEALRFTRALLPYFSPFLFRTSAWNCRRWVARASAASPSKLAGRPFDARQSVVKKTYIIHYMLRFPGFT